MDAIAGVALLALLLGGASVYAVWLEGSEPGVDRHALRYSSLVDALGQLDPDSVDGPPRAGPRTLTLDQISKHARTLAAHLRNDHATKSLHRVAVLAAQLDAVALRADRLAGRTVSFSDELRQLLAVDESLLRQADSVDGLRSRLDRLLPGSGPLSRRLDAYQRHFVVPRGRLHSVVVRALAACRAQTTRHVQLPAEETIDIEYVADRPWSGYSFYRGGYRSTVQINRAFPLTVDQILNLACHEGYPGHHVYNVLRDRDLVRGRGWPEASVLPVFSPEGFRAEAIATAAATLAFSREERIALFRDELFPASGLDGMEVENYVDVSAMMEALSGETSAVVVGYLEGKIDRHEAEHFLRQRALMEHPESTLAFVDRYRAYALAYTVGREWLSSGLTERNSDWWTDLANLIVGNHPRGLFPVDAASSTSLLGHQLRVSPPRDRDAPG